MERRRERATTARHAAAGLGLFALALVTASVLAGCESCGSSSDSKVLAVVDGEPLTEERFAAYLKYKHVPNEPGPHRARALAEYLDRAAMAAAIRKQKVVNAEDIAVEVEEFEKQLLIGRHFDAVMDEKVTEDAVRNYYDAHSEDYQERKVHVAHVLQRTNGKMEETERRAKLTRAQEAHSKIVAGDEFAAVAEAFSDDRVSSRRGGDLGWLKEGAVDPRFSEKVFAMKAGEVSEPFLSSFGYHVVQVLEGPAVIKRPFSTVQGEIRYQLRAKAKEAEAERLGSAIEVERKDSATPKPASDKLEGKTAESTKSAAAQEEK